MIKIKKILQKIVDSIKKLFKTIFQFVHPREITP